MRISTHRRLVGTPAALLLVAGATVACQDSSRTHAHVASPTAGAATGQRTYFPQYGVDTRAYRPRRVNASVDGSLYVTGMRWAAWDARTAVGTGVAHVNDCKPNCAAGHYTTYRVTVRLSQPRELCGSLFFTTLRVRGSGYRTFGHRTGVGCEDGSGEAGA
jgi:hypothetical protein